MIQAPENARDIGVGYGYTAITGLCGLMTYRYLRLCCANTGFLKEASKFAKYDDLVRFERDNCFIDHFVRQERLEASLCEGVDRVRPLTDAEREWYSQLHESIDRSVVDDSVNIMTLRPSL